ncbi:helix-turn-helix domain-containing protein, partial [Sphingomonas sanguinis]|uniref:helix-turn-helix domain-containing protein n=1 Tax=Sphingomonas sanguinis TaxID=33051 RepID=UPI0007369E58
ILPIAGSARLSRNDAAMRPLRADQFDDITAGALRAARALLNWPAEKLAEEAGISRSTIRRLENGEATTTPRRGSVEKILSVLARQNIRCLGQNGVIEGVVCAPSQDAAAAVLKPQSHSTH